MGTANPVAVSHHVITLLQIRWLPGSLRNSVESVLWHFRAFPYELAVVHHALRKPRASSTVHEKPWRAQSVKDRISPEILSTRRTRAAP